MGLLLDGGNAHAAISHEEVKRDLHRAGPDEVAGVVPILMYSELQAELCSGTKLSDTVILTAQHCNTAGRTAYVFPSNIPDPTGIKLDEWENPNFFPSIGGIKVSRQLYYNRDSYVHDGWEANDHDGSRRRIKIHRWRYDISLLVLAEPLQGVPNVRLNATNDFRTTAHIAGYGRFGVYRGEKRVGEVRRFRKKYGTYRFEAKDADTIETEFGGGPGFSGGFFGQIDADGTSLQIGVIAGTFAPINWWNGKYIRGYHMAPITHDVVCWIQKSAALGFGESCDP